MKLVLLFAIVFLAGSAHAQNVTTVRLSPNDANYFFTRFQALDAIVIPNPSNPSDYAEVFAYSTSNGAFTARCETKYGAGIETGPRACTFTFDQSKSEPATGFSHGANGNSIVALIQDPQDFHTLWTVVGAPLGGSILIVGIDIVAITYSNETVAESKIQMSCGNSYCTVTVFKP
jgi:hypothetical protein